MMAPKVYGTGILQLCSALRHLIIPASWKELPHYTCAQCRELRSVYWQPNSRCRMIRNGAFSYCERLRHCNVPPSVRCIASNVWTECSRLRTLDLGRVKVLGDNILSYTSALQTLDIPCTVTAIGGGVLDYSGVKHLRWHSRVAIPTACARDARRLTTVELLAPVPCIGNSAFMSTPRLQSFQVAFPLALHTIENAAFYASGIPAFCWAQCRQLKRVGRDAFRESKIQTVDAMQPSIVWGDCVFCNCRRLTTVAISGTDITACMFQHCERLISVTMTKSITHIGCMAFDHCIRLQLLENCCPRDIEEEAFAHCHCLTALDTSQLVCLGARACAHMYQLRHVELSSQLTSLGHAVFQYAGLVSFVSYADISAIPSECCAHCIHLTSVRILSDCIKDVEEQAFLGTSALEECILFLERLDTIVSECFYGSGLRTLLVPPMVTRVGRCAFAQSCIQNITFLSSEIRFGDECFADALELSAIVLPPRTRFLPRRMFYRATKLHTVTFPVALEHLATEAIAYTAIRNLELPSSLSVLSDRAIVHNTRLYTLTFHPLTQLTSIGVYTLAWNPFLYKVQWPRVMKRLGVYMLHGTFCKVHASKRHPLERKRKHK